MLRADVEEQFFATALVSLVDPIRRTMLCASAGHPGPLVWTGDGQVHDAFLDRGLPLGLRELAPASETSQALNTHVGCFATFFTDGLLEWNRDIAASWNALDRSIRMQHIRDAEHPAKKIRDAVIDGDSHDDDIAIFTVRWDVEARSAALRA